MAHTIRRLHVRSFLGIIVAPLAIVSVVAACAGPSGVAVSPAEQQIVACTASAALNSTASAYGASLTPAQLAALKSSGEILTAFCTAPATPTPAPASAVAASK